MKYILTAAAVFVLAFSATACSSSVPAADTSIISQTTAPAETTVTYNTTVSSATTTIKTTVTTELSQTSSSTCTLTETTSISEVSSETDTWETLKPYTKVEVPFVAWSEVNLEKTMHTISRCKGYELALSDASAKMIYDAGIALEVIARTDTGYYRIKGDLYIPCDFLDNAIPDGINAAAATSCTVYAAPAVTTASSAAVTTAIVKAG